MPRPAQRILDLGAGVGAVGLCLAARLAGCSVVGIELQPALAELAERNANLNGMADRVRTVVHDLAQPLPADLGRFDHVVTNPPYLAAAVADPSPDPSKALATVESSADLARWLAVATARRGTCRHPAHHPSQRPAGRDPWPSRPPGLGRRHGEAPAARGPRPGARPSRRPADATRRAAAHAASCRTGGYTDEAEAILRHAGALAF